MTDSKLPKLDEKRMAYVRLTSAVLWYTTDFFHKEGFLQLMPVILSPITDPLGPDPGSTVIKTGEIEYLEQKLVLTQSMILHKQLAVRDGLEKLFIISPNVRLEHPKRRESKKHLFEFSQVDFEIAHAKKEDVFALMERFLVGLVPHVKRECAAELSLLGRKLQDVVGPFMKYSTHELEEKYGKDWEMLASLDTHQPFWALCHKREFYDKEDPHEEGHYLNYDLIYPEGFCEALSGAEREHEFGIIMKKIDCDGLDKSRYGPYLEFAKHGLVPSAGAGFGVERLVRWLAGADHIGDVQLFKRVPGEKVIV
ncbi:TPA: asparagine synthetase [Candidatus Micrarchaeota archaeon]|nr:asparagine synthetase [Candidatus Micrarchaeota archaeon]